MTPIAIILVIVIMLAMVTIRYNLYLKATAKAYAEEAKQLHEKLQKFIAPTHLFTDEELMRIKREFNPLLRKVNRLYDSPFVSNKYLDKLGLNDFINERKYLNHTQLVNNQSQISKNRYDKNNELQKQYNL